MKFVTDKFQTGIITIITSAVLKVQITLMNVNFWNGTYRKEEISL